MGCPGGRDKRPLFLYTPKRGIDVWVMWLKPVPERLPDKQCCRSRRGPLQDEMPAVEEVGRIAGIKRKWLKSREGRECGAGPFPAVTHKIVNTERAAALGNGSNGMRRPGSKIKVAGWTSCIT